MTLKESDIEGLKAVVFVNDALLVAIARAVRNAPGIRAHFEQLIEEHEEQLLDSTASHSQVEEFRQHVATTMAVVWGTGDEPSQPRAS